FGLIYGSKLKDPRTQIFLTKNGIFVGRVYDSDSRFDKFPWFPCVGTDSHNCLELNFGNKGVAFVFDLQGFEDGGGPYACCREGSKGGSSGKEGGKEGVKEGGEGSSSSSSSEGPLGDARDLIPEIPQWQPLPFLQPQLQTSAAAAVLHSTYPTPILVSSWSSAVKVQGAGAGVGVGIPPPGARGAPGGIGACLFSRGLRSTKTADLTFRFNSPRLRSLVEVIENMYGIPKRKGKVSVPVEDDAESVWSDVDEEDEEED
ncbi:hypothetical protein B484DRAFT_399080, partial [Ochromonadaceae sp. CCMP2298]